MWIKSRASAVSFQHAWRRQSDRLGRLGAQALSRHESCVDVLFASAGMGEASKLGKITEKHFDTVFGLNTRGTLFTVQKALPLFNNGGSIFMTGSIASVEGWVDYSVYSASKAALRSFARTWLNRIGGQRNPGERAEPGADRHTDSGTVVRRGDETAVRSLDPAGKNGPP